MRGLALVVACVACVSCAHKVQTASEKSDDVKQLASLLATLNPSAAFKQPGAESSGPSASNARALLSRRGALAAAAPALLAPFAASAAKNKLPTCVRKEDGYWNDPCKNNKWRDKDDPNPYQEGKFVMVKPTENGLYTDIPKYTIEAKIDEGKRTMFLYVNDDGKTQVAEGKTKDESDHLSFQLDGKPVYATWVGNGWDLDNGMQWKNVNVKKFWDGTYTVKKPEPKAKK